MGGCRTETWGSSDLCNLLLSRFLNLMSGGIAENFNMSISSIFSSPSPSMFHGRSCPLTFPYRVALWKSLALFLNLNFVPAITDHYFFQEFMRMVMAKIHGLIPFLGFMVVPVNW